MRQPLISMKPRKRNSVSSMLRALSLAGSALLSAGAQAQQPAASGAAVNETPPTVAVTPIEPIVPPIQRVLPPQPKLDPRLSARPVAAGKVAAKNGKSLVAKRTPAAKSKATVTPVPAQNATAIPRKPGTSAPTDNKAAAATTPGPTPRSKPQ